MTHFLCFIDNFFLILTKTIFIALLKKDELSVTLILCFFNFDKILKYFISVSLDDFKALKTTFNLKTKIKICYHYCNSMNKRSCRQLCKKKTLKTEVRALKILIKMYMYLI